MAGNDDARLRAHLDAAPGKSAQKRATAKKAATKKATTRKTVTDKTVAEDKAPSQKPAKKSARSRKAAASGTALLPNNAPFPNIAPLEVILETMRDLWARAETEEDPATRAALRKEAAGLAKDAAPYVHPRLAAVNHTGGVALRHEDAIEELA